MIEALERLVLDWRDFERAGEASRRMLRDLQSEPGALRELVYRVERDERLLALCERHQLLDYLVIHDALDRGVRLRLHVSTRDHFDRPHDHRFSFSSLIVRGRYKHTLYDVSEAVYRDDDDLERLRPWIDIDHPDPRPRIRESNLTAYLARDEKAGDCYSLHHSMVHTTFTTPDTVSLFLRGPAEKERSFIYDLETRRMWWRFGHEEESEERRRRKRMGLDHYLVLRARLEALGVI